MIYSVFQLAEDSLKKQMENQRFSEKESSRNHKVNLTADNTL